MGKGRSSAIKPILGRLLKSRRSIQNASFVTIVAEGRFLDSPIASSPRMLRVPFAGIRRSPPQCLQGEDRLPHLTPKRRLVAAEPLEHAVVKISEAQEAPRCIELKIRHRRGRCWSFAMHRIVVAAVSCIRDLDVGQFTESDYRGSCAILAELGL